MTAALAEEESDDSRADGQKIENITLRVWAVGTREAAEMFQWAVILPSASSKCMQSSRGWPTAPEHGHPVPLSLVWSPLGFTEIVPSENEREDEKAQERHGIVKCHTMSLGQQKYLWVLAQGTKPKDGVGLALKGSQDWAL